jgi:hypothetical protein
MSKKHEQSQLQQILIRRHLKQLHQMQKQVRFVIYSMKAETGTTELNLQRLNVLKHYFANGRSNALHQHVDDFEDEGDRRHWIEFCDKRKSICKETWEAINIALYGHYANHTKWNLPNYRLN